MTEPLVSVVIPVYNGAEYLRTALESALEQSYEPLEIIVVDDGSTDQSPQIIDSYEGRVLAFRQANCGVARARNVGIRAARGDWVAFLDQDDWWLPEKIRKQVDLAQTDPEIGLVHTDVEHFDADSDCYVKRFNPNRSDLLIDRCYERLLLGNAIFNCTAMVRKTVLDHVGGFNEDMPGNTVQDYDLWLRVAKLSNLAYVPEKLATYRLHSAQGMWRVQNYLAAEVKVLERFVGDFQRVASKEMKNRLVKLLDELGVAYLDAQNHRLARQCFARALGLRRSMRVAALYAASFLPAGSLKLLREAKYYVGQFVGRRSESAVPAWAREGSQKDRVARGQYLADSAAID
jgi:glycosyltransferase involved in cell wall biosynthesis